MTDRRHFDDDERRDLRDVLDLGLPGTSNTLRSLAGNGEASASEVLVAYTALTEADEHPALTPGEAALVRRVHSMLGVASAQMIELEQTPRPETVIRLSEQDAETLMMVATRYERRTLSDDAWECGDPVVSDVARALRTIAVGGVRHHDGALAPALAALAAYLPTAQPLDFHARVRQALYALHYALARECSAM